MPVSIIEQEQLLEPTVRQRLHEARTLDDVVKLLEKSKRIIVVSGAGISVSAGIPDFRSKDSGLYHTLDCSRYGIPSAELLFDIEFFKIDPGPFYQFANMLLPNDDIRPTKCHQFLQILQSKKKLLRNYTQNIDGLERKAGITNLVECHGHMNTFKCMKCKRKKYLLDVIEDVRDGNVCYCTCGEVLKPNVTFFGEELPKVLFTKMKQDLNKCDLVLIIGTSLKVGGSVHEVLKGVRRSVPQILINKDEVCLPSHMSEGFDVNILGKCDDIAQYLCARLNWDGLTDACPATSKPLLEHSVTHEAHNSTTSSGLGVVSTQSSDTTIDMPSVSCEVNKSSVHSKKRKRCVEDSSDAKFTKKSQLQKQWNCTLNYDRFFSVEPR